MKKKRNPQFTTDEAQTATLLVTEGWAGCHRARIRGKWYRYPRIRIGICDKEALEPAARVFKTTIGVHREKTIRCPPHLFPPDGLGFWEISKVGKPAEQLVEHLKPLLTKEFLKKWEKIRETCRE